jgi:hypothetical protein
MIGLMDRCGLWCQLFDSPVASYTVGCQRIRGHKGNRHMHKMKDKYGHDITVYWTDEK